MPNPLQEQKDLLSGNCAVLLNKQILELTGEERLTWLNDMLSQKLDELKPGQSVEALWLDAQGHILRDFHIVDDGSSTFLITFDAGFAEFLTAFSRMVFRAKVVIKHRSDLKVVACFNEPLGELYWQDPWPETTSGGWRYGKVSDQPWNYFESLLGDVSSIPLASELALTALRIAAFRPQGPNELDQRSLPHEFDWLATAVHLSKGCYRGQETVAKIHNLGAPPRKLVFLHIDGSGHLLPEAGDEIIFEDVMGVITSVATHYEMGPIALGLIKRNSKAETVSVKLSSGEMISAAVEEIVPSDAGGVVDLGDFRTKRKPDSSQ